MRIGEQNEEILNLKNDHEELQKVNKRLQGELTQARVQNLN